MESTVCGHVHSTRVWKDKESILTLNMLVMVDGTHANLLSASWMRNFVYFDPVLVPYGLCGYACHTFNLDNH